MIVGHNHHRLEKRITAALLGAIPNPREAYFLQKMSERILHKGKNTWLSDRQAEWLFAILAHCEKKQSPPPKRPLPPPRLPRPQPQSEGPEPFRIEECFVDPQAAPQHSPRQPDHAAPPAPTQPTQAAEPVATREPDIGSIIRRVIARNENLRKRRERIERQRTKSSLISSSLYSPPEFLLK
ncbi:hypothetical protein [Bradyrhizobium sp. SZCCHNRI2014]|uniref:hypothetical protein n=1 Tax=Bradyrhizobium sp. SZCCHNRI2014 TaxID=3057285 RepID=UPI0029170CD7|nr:hypothetical protein [Bradyrhizobium sp. SZCCHNRI2014]